MSQKFIFLLLVFLIFTSCRDDKSEAGKNLDKDHTEALSFYNESLSSKDFKACENTECPTIRVNYLKFREDQEVAKTMNRYNENNLIKIFSNTEADTIAPSLKAAIKGFVKDYQYFKSDFPDSEAGYEVEISQSVLSRDGDLLVLETDFYLFTGGAHGYGAKLFTNFDIASGETLTKDELFSDLHAFKDFAEKEFRIKYEVPEGQSINSKGFFFENDKFALPENIALTKNQVILIYNRYEAASYAEGELKLSFSRNKVNQWLNY
jgi:hypothetical protein